MRKPCCHRPRSYKRLHLTLSEVKITQFPGSNSLLRLRLFNMPRIAAKKPTGISPFAYISFVWKIFAKKREEWISHLQDDIAEVLVLPHLVQRGREGVRVRLPVLPLHAADHALIVVVAVGGGGVAVPSRAVGRGGGGSAGGGGGGAALRGGHRAAARRGGEAGHLEVAVVAAVVLVVLNLVVQPAREKALFEMEGWMRTLVSPSYDASRKMCCSVQN